MSKTFNNSTKHNEKRRYFSVYRKTKIVITYSEKEGYRGYKWAGKFVECNEVLRNYLLTEVRIKELFPATTSKVHVNMKHMNYLQLRTDGKIYLVLDVPKEPITNAIPVEDKKKAGHLIYGKHFDGSITWRIKVNELYIYDGEYEIIEREISVGNAGSTSYPTFEKLAILK
jgi:hypothetical protein